MSELIKIGTLIRTNTITTVKYDEHGIKQLFHNTIPECECYVQRIVRKSLGKYIKGSGYDPEDQIQPYLCVTSTVILYQCVKTITSKPFLVLPINAEILCQN